MDRSQRRLFAIGWLFVLHMLFDITVGVYRCHDIAPQLTDLLAAAFPRAQTCLLVAWLFCGTERLSWRICGTVSGLCFLFLVFSRLLFPGFYRSLPHYFWTEGEWVDYFRVSGPGDWLVKLPILVLGMAIPCALRRGLDLVVWMRIPADQRRWPQFRNLVRFQLQDIAIWLTSACFVLAAVYNTADSDGWFTNLFSRLDRVHQMQTDLSFYMLMVSFLYVAIALAAIWSVVRNKNFKPVRLFAPFGIAVFGGLAFEIWLKQIARASEASAAPAHLFSFTSETFTAMAAATITLASLFLVRAYEKKPQPASGRRQLPASLQRFKSNKSVSSFSRTACIKRASSVHQVCSWVTLLRQREVRVAGIERASPTANRTTPADKKTTLTLLSLIHI